VREYNKNTRVIVDRGFIASQLDIHEGSRVLEMGSGWGPFCNMQA